MDSLTVVIPQYESLSEVLGRMNENIQGFRPAFAEAERAGRFKALFDDLHSLCLFLWR
jgi:hypothetical protein